MSYNGVTRNDVKKLAAQIEVFAKEMQTKLVGSDDVLPIGSEILRNATTLAFALGELYHAENTGTVKVTPVKTGVTHNANYHNKRDNRGRFSR